MLQRRLLQALRDALTEQVQIIRHGMVVHAVKRQVAMAPMHDFLVGRFKSMEELLAKNGVVV
jgi:hypothetical protein